MQISSSTLSELFPSQLDAIPDLCQLKEFIPPALLGIEGKNRNVNPYTPNQIQFNNVLVDNDIDAIQAWLEIKSRKSPHTYRAYKNEATRFYFWAISCLGKPVSSITGEDLVEFDNWLKNPTRHPGWPATWQFFKKGGIQTISRSRSMTVIGNMFDWLHRGGYLASTPFSITDFSIDQKKERANNQQRGIQRYFEEELWEWLEAYLDKLPEGNESQKKKKARLAFIVRFGYWTAARRSDLVHSRMGYIFPMNGQWIWQVQEGKGGKVGNIVLVKPALSALTAYRQTRDLPNTPSITEKDEPLVCNINGTKGIQEWQLNNLLKSFFCQAANDMEEINSSYAAKLRQASSHWLRHSWATHAANAGVILTTLADQMRHSSTETSKRFYIGDNLNKRHDELAKMEKS